MFRYEAIFHCALKLQAPAEVLPRSLQSMMEFKNSADFRYLPPKHFFFLLPQFQIIALLSLSHPQPLRRRMPLVRWRQSAHAIRYSFASPRSWLWNHCSSRVQVAYSFITRHRQSQKVIFGIRQLGFEAARGATINKGGLVSA